MRKTTWSLALMLIAPFALAGGTTGGKKMPPDKHDATVLNETLRDVIDAGAKIFNDNGDHAGCYRLWQGSLMSIRPFVPPDMQAAIDKGLASAAKCDNYADRAFELRKVLDDIRAKTKGSGGSETTKKTSGGAGLVAGKLTYQGQPVAGGYFVTLVSDARKFSTAIQKDGAFEFKTPIPLGDYRVAVQRIPDENIKGQPLPARYGSADTSGLAINVQAGKQNVELNLVN